MSDIRARLSQIAARKRQREDIVSDLKAGKYDGIFNASDYFADHPAVGRNRVELGAPQAQAVAPAVPFPDMKLHEGERGRFLYRDLLVDPIALDGNLPFDGEQLHLVTKDCKPLADLSKVVFLDTETTGLMGATGTVAFMVGIARWQPNPWKLRVTQYLIEDFCHEEEMLRRLVADIEDAEVLCTYNGKSYDIPLLRARSILARIRPSVWAKSHADLLHHSRRLWRRRLSSVSLKHVEREILGIDRGPDVDGSMIPQSFFDFARTGEPGIMPAVLQHNVQDVVSLPCLLAKLTAIAREPLRPGLLSHASEYAAISRWLAARGMKEASFAALNRALEVVRERDEEAELLGQLASTYKRRREWTEALEVWTTLQRLPIVRSLTSWLEVAKYHEHVTRDHGRALDVVQRCRQRIEMEVELRAIRGGERTESRALEDLDRRELRLMKKLRAGRRDG